MEKVLGTIQVYQKELRCDNTYAGAMYSSDLIYSVEFVDEEWLSYDTLEWYGANVIDGSSQVLDYDFATKKLKVPYGLYQQDGLIYITLRGVSGDVKYSADLLRLNVGLAVNIEKNNIVEDPSWIDEAYKIIEELITTRYDPASAGLIAEAKRQQEVVKAIQGEVKTQQEQIDTAISQLGIYEWNGSQIRFKQGDGNWGEWHDVSGDFATKLELQSLRDDAILDVDVISNLYTDSDTKPLSAAMGKKLDEDKLDVSDIVNDVISGGKEKILSAEQGKVLAEYGNGLKQEIDVLESRMNQFTSLEEGSTTGDAELADIRVGFDGKTYDSAGSAVRSQVGQLSSDIDTIEDSVSYRLLYDVNSTNMVQGTIDKDTGIESSSDNTIRSKDFIDVSKVVSFVYSGITSSEYYVRAVYYDDDNVFIEGTDGVVANKDPVKFAIPYNAKKMKIVIAYLNLSDIGFVKPNIDFSKLANLDKIYKSIKTGFYKKYVNNWEILEGKFVDIPYGQHIKFTNSRNSCTKNFLHAQKGDELILQSPISFYVLLFSEADDTTCFYNSYKDGRFFTEYKFKTDCFFMLNFTNQIDMSAETSPSDIVWTKKTVKDTQEVFVVPNAEYSTIHVASAWASDEEKLGADYVCDGVNDGEELQQAIFDLRARGGGVLKLSNERYIIDTLFDSGVPSVGKYGIYIPTNNYNTSIIKIEGVNFPNVIQPMYFGHCARLDMSQELYDSLDENEIISMIGVRPVINKENVPSRSSVGCTLSIENVAINIPAPQKKIIGVNCEYAYNMQLKGVHCGLTEYAGDPQEPNGKIINSIIDCIGIRTLYGYNWGSGYHIDDCNVRGWGLGFDISGEHLIMQNACARFVNTGYRFGHFGDDSMMSHPNTLINCCEEWLLHGMVFERNSMLQSLNIIDFNIEDMTSNGWGRKTYATETNPGNYHGTLTYTTTRDSYKNTPHKFWEDGSGINILTRDLNDKFSGTTEERPQNPQNNQQYFDTTINKMLYYINNKWVDSMGTTID